MSIMMGKLVRSTILSSLFDERILEFDEFARIYGQQANASNDEELLVFFKTFDKDSSGFIDKNELREVSCVVEMDTNHSDYECHGRNCHR